MKSNLIAVIGSILLTIFVLMFSYKVYTSKTNNNVIDSLYNKANVEKAILLDTIVKYDTIKTKAATLYKLKRDTLWLMKADSVDTMFNKVFARDSLDTSDYSTGYTQLRKALDANNRHARDSIDIMSASKKLETCTATVTTIVNQIDTARTEVSDNKLVNGLILGGSVVATALFVGFIAK